MGYFIREGVPFTILGPGRETPYHEDWLTLVIPGITVFKVLAAKDQEDNLWKKLGYWSPPYISINENDDSYLSLLNPKDSQEISKEEACLILFEAQDNNDPLRHQGYAP